MKRIISALLVLIMAVSLFAACTPNTPAKTKNQAKTNQAKTQAKTESNDDLDKWGRPVVESAIPDSKQFNGETVNFVYDSSRNDEFTVENTNGDVINDAIFQRNLKVEEDLNIHLNFIKIAGAANKEFATAINTSVMTGTGDYDIAAGYAYFLTSTIKSFPYANLYDIEQGSSLDLSKPWWSQRYINEVTLNDQLYTVVGDICLSATSNAGCIFFNKRLANEHLQNFGGTDGLYQLVEDYEWTIDKFTEIVKETYNDADGDGQRSEGDFYGFASWWSGPIPSDSFQYGMDAPITRKNSSGGIDFVYDDGKMVSVVEKLWALNNDCQGVLYNSEYYNKRDKSNMIINKFVNGELIFVAYSLDEANSFRQMDDDFGLLPMPMYDTNQKEYYTSQQDGYSAIAVVYSVEEFERTDLVGTTLEKLCEESYRDVNPNFFEVVMKYRYLRTDSENKKDIDMYDKIIDGNNFNFGLVFSSALENVSFTLRYVIGKYNNKLFTSEWEKKADQVKINFENLVEWFYEE